MIVTGLPILWGWGRPSSLLTDGDGSGIVLQARLDRAAKRLVLTEDGTYRVVAKGLR